MTTLFECSIPSLKVSTIDEDNCPPGREFKIYEVRFDVRIRGEHANRTAAVCSTHSANMAIEDFANFLGEFLKDEVRKVQMATEGNVGRAE